LELEKSVDTSKSEPLQETFLIVTAVFWIFNYICSTSSSDMHFCLEYDHKLTKKIQSTHSLTTENVGLLSLYVAEQSVTCTNSSPVVPYTLTCLPPRGDIFVGWKLYKLSRPSSNKKNLRFITGFCSFIFCPQSHHHKTVGTFMIYAGITFINMYLFLNIYAIHM